MFLISSTSGKIGNSSFLSVNFMAFVIENNFTLLDPVLAAKILFICIKGKKFFSITSPCLRLPSPKHHRGIEGEILSYV